MGQNRYAALEKQNLVSLLRRDDLVPQQSGVNWTHPDIGVRTTSNLGLGLVALAAIPKGTTIILYGGKLMSWAEVQTLPPELWDIPYQVSDDIFYGVSSRADVGIGERINHSCQPNTGFVSEMRLIAIRDIDPGEDVSMDYGACTSMASYRMKCLCGHKNCRGVVTGEDWKDSNFQIQLKGHFQPYIQHKINSSHAPIAVCSYEALSPLRSSTRRGRLLEVAGRLTRFFLNAYKNHWIASPAGMLAALISSVGIASVMLLISPIIHELFSNGLAITLNAIVAPLLAYVVYLSVYYFCMFLSERSTLINSGNQIDRQKLVSWVRVVKYDYLAHVPSDIYLITCAGILQAALEANGRGIFSAVLISQFLDDLITFLKEPAIWSGAKEIVAWENRADTTLGAKLLRKLR